MAALYSRTWLSDFPFTFHFNALEKEMATHSGVLAWRIPGMEEPGGLSSVGLHRVGHDWSDLAAAAALYSTVLVQVHLKKGTDILFVPSCCFHIILSPSSLKLWTPHQIACCFFLLLLLTNSQDTPNPVFSVILVSGSKSTFLNTVTLSVKRKINIIGILLLWSSLLQCSIIHTTSVTNSHCLKTLIPLTILLCFLSFSPLHPQLQLCYFLPYKRLYNLIVLFCFCFPPYRM